MQKRTTAVSTVKVVIITLDHHLASAIARINERLAHAVPGLKIALHAASDWAARPEMLETCKADIASANIVIANMLFMEEHVNAVLPHAANAPRQAGCVGGFHVSWRSHQTDPGWPF